ncbi:MAG: tRNA-dihydrouridine synthase [Pirellulales bacterium]|nr:tRNA-dihydrouridine synthase [Pirellulales bacterium]
MTPDNPEKPPLRLGPLAIAPPILAAPLAGFSNFAFRQILRNLGGVGLPATEMLSARGFLFLEDRKQAQPERLWGVKDEPRPLAVQIWDNDPDKLAEVGRRIAQEFRASVVDLNFGCPARDVAQKAESGAYLLGDPQRVGDLVARVVTACRPTPVTAKIRLGLARDAVNAVDVAQAVEGAGGAAVTVHGRTADQLYRGRADWDAIARIKPHLKKMPLIGNGDLKTSDDVLQAFRRYGVDGVMIGRAALRRPWLFREAAAALAGQPIPPEPTAEEQQELLREHFRLIVAQFGPEKGTVMMRALAAPYATGRPGVRRFRAAVARIATPEDFDRVLKEEYPGSLVVGR